MTTGSESYAGVVEATPSEGDEKKTQGVGLQPLNIHHSSKPH